MSSDNHAAIKAFLSLEKETFRDWLSPENALIELDRIGVTLQSDYSFDSGAFVTHREGKELREMWVLAKCALLIKIPRIKLSFDGRFDGYLNRDGKIAPAEVIEILEPGRKRNLEFRSDAPSLKMDPVENWVRRANSIPEALETGITNKKAKLYPKGTELFVYLNIDEYGIQQKEIEEKISSSIARPIEPFDAIYVRWKSKVFSDCGSVFVTDEKIPDPDNDADEEALWRSIIGDERG